MNEHSTTKYNVHKSLRHQITREALPRLDNYRNILSIQAGHRPTLDELHNNTVQDDRVKTRVFFPFLPRIEALGGYFWTTGMKGRFVRGLKQTRRVMKNLFKSLRDLLVFGC